MSVKPRSDKLFLELEGEEFYSKNAIRNAYGLNTDEEADALADITKKLKNKTDLQADEKKILKEAITNRIAKLSELKGIPQNTLILQPGLAAKRKLETRLQRLNAAPTAPSAAKQPLSPNAAKFKDANQVMMLLIKIGYQLIHDPSPTDEDFTKWNQFLTSMGALTDEGDLLNTTTPSYASNSLTITKNELTKTPSTLNDYIKSITNSQSTTQKARNASDKLKKRLTDMLEVLRTAHIIDVADKDYENANDNGRRALDAKIRNSITERFKNSVALLIAHYTQLFGEANTTLLKSKLDELFNRTREPLPRYLPIIDGIINNVVSKLNLFGSDKDDKRYDSLGIYKFDDDISVILKDYIDGYRSAMNALTMSDPMKKQQPFVWFYLGSELIVPANLQGTIFDLDSTQKKTFTEFMKGTSEGITKDTVFMVVHYGVPAQPSDILCRLFDYGKDGPKPTGDWNTRADRITPLGILPVNTPSTTPISFVATPTPIKEVVSGMTMGSIGVTSIDFPPFDIRKHVSLSTLQFSALLEANKPN